MDKYNTFQTCGECYKKFDKKKRREREKRGIRYRVSDDYHPVSNMLNPRSTSKSQQQQQQQQKIACAIECLPEAPRNILARCK